jgi:hypothetical protein
VAGSKATEKPDQTPWSRPRVTGVDLMPAVVRRVIMWAARVGEPLFGYWAL